MITPINKQYSNPVQFKAVPKTINRQKLTGELRHSTISQIASLKAAVKDILTNFAKDGSSPKVKAITDKFNILLKDNIKLVSAMGIGSTITLFLTKNQRKEDCLGIEVKDPNSIDVSYILEGSKVINNNSTRKKYLTTSEIEELGIENFLQRVSESIDLPLLRLRQAQQPEIEPYVPQMLPLEIKTTAVETDPTTTLEEQEKNEESLSTIVEEPFFVITKESNTTTRKSVNQDKIDTSFEIDNLIRRIKGQPELRVNNVSNTDSIENDFGNGKISNRTQELLTEVLSLFSTIDSIYEAKGPSLLPTLKKKISSLTLYRKASSITFQNIGPEGMGVSLVKSHSKRHNGDDIIAIYKRDSKGNVIDVIPICNNKVYRMMKSFSFDKTNQFINLVSVKYCLSQNEIKSKNLDNTLELIKKEMEAIIGAADSKDALVSTEIMERLERIDKKREELKEKEKKAKGFSSTTFQNLKVGGLFFRCVNKDGNNITYINGTENKRMPGTILVKLTNRDGSFKNGWLLKDGKVLKHYNGKNNYYPREIKYHNRFELEQINFEEEMLKCLNLIEERLELAERVLDTYQSAKNFARTNRFF